MLSARWEANDNKLQCKLTLWIGKHVFFKYFTVKLHVNLIRDIDTLERYSKDFKSITGSCCCSRVGTRAKLKCNGFVWKEGEERARASRPVPRGHDGYVFSPPLSTLHSPLWHHSLLSDLLVIWKQCGITWRNKATDWGTRFCWIMRVSRGEISRLGVLGVVNRENCWLIVVASRRRTGLRRIIEDGKEDGMGGQRASQCVGSIVTCGEAPNLVWHWRQFVWVLPMCFVMTN